MLECTRYLSKVILSCNVICNSIIIVVITKISYLSKDVVSFITVTNKSEQTYCSL